MAVLICPALYLLVKGTAIHPRLSHLRQEGSSSISVGVWRLRNQHLEMFLNNMNYMHFIKWLIRRIPWGRAATYAFQIDPEQCIYIPHRYGSLWDIWSFHLCCQTWMGMCNFFNIGNNIVWNSWIQEKVVQHQETYFVDLIMDMRKSSMYASNENWYIGSIDTNSFSIK